MKFSRVCGRFQRCCDKLSQGTLEAKDICTGGKNCDGGICGDTCSFDPSAFIINEENWKTGKVLDTGINLTEYGLTPRNQQIMEKGEKERNAVRKKACAEIHSKKHMPTLNESGTTSAISKYGTGCWGNFSGSAMLKVSNEKEKERAHYYQHNGKIYRYFLDKTQGQYFTIIHGRGWVNEKHPTEYRKIAEINPLTTDELIEYRSEIELALDTILSSLDEKEIVEEEKETVEEEKEFVEEVKEAVIVEEEAVIVEKEDGVISSSEDLTEALINPNEYHDEYAQEDEDDDEDDYERYYEEYDEDVCSDWEDGYSDDEY